MEKTTEKTVHWMRLVHGQRSIYLAATADGLCFASPYYAPFEELSDWKEKRLPGSTLVEDVEMMKPYADELIDYLEGRLQTFTMPLDLHGTPFQQAVWEALIDIPYGKTVSYSDIAESIGKPEAVRAVGAAIGANPILITVPCHRVIGKNGKLTGFRGGLDMKEQLLALEFSTANEKTTR